MSLPVHEGPSRQEEERLPLVKVAAVGVAALVIFAIGVTGMGLILRYGSRADAPQGDAPLPDQAGQVEVGMVFQTPFSKAALGEQHLREQRERLRSYGWVDREKGLIHVPVDRAIEELLAKQGGPKP